MSARDERNAAVWGMPLNLTVPYGQSSISGQNGMS